MGQGEELKKRLSEAVGEANLKLDEPMKYHTTFRIGGAADYYISPPGEEELLASVRILKEEKIPFFVMGNGSNLLVSDEGYRGAIIAMGRGMGSIEVEGNCIKAGAGALLSSISAKAREASLTGLEFAGGIPGTLGGACMMNAGAYGGEMKQVLRNVTCMAPSGEVLVLDAEEMELGYRTSVFMKKGYIVLNATMELKEGDQDEISAVMADLSQRRRTKQPLEYPSAGSTFKRPEGYFAGKLIMDAGLAGYTVGGACVSEKHCGFVINRKDATAAEVLQLIRDVQRKVKEQFQVELLPEVRFLGEFHE